METHLTARVRTAGIPARCPRCSGRMVAEVDWLSSYGNCLVCGYIYEPERLAAAVVRAEAEADLASRSLEPVGVER